MKCSQGTYIRAASLGRGRKRRYRHSYLGDIARPTDEQLAASQGTFSLERKISSCRRQAKTPPPQDKLDTKSLLKSFYRCLCSTYTYSRAEIPG